VNFNGSKWTLVVHCGLWWFTVDFSSYEKQLYEKNIQTIWLGPKGPLHYGETIEIAVSINCPDPQNV